MATAEKLGVFESALVDAYRWVHELQAELSWGEPHYALHALRAALHGLRDRLSVEQSAHLSAQLPLLIRGMFYEGWVPARTPAPERHLDAFLNHLDRELRQSADAYDPEHVARKVFVILRRHVTPGVIDHVMATLPSDLRNLWNS
jgi:uncharacterized protein (DUF2267 family)